MAGAGVGGCGTGQDKGPQKTTWSSYISSPIKDLKSLLPGGGRGFQSSGGQVKEKSLEGAPEHGIIQTQSEATGSDIPIDKDWETVQVPKVRMDVVSNTRLNLKIFRLRQVFETSMDMSLIIIDNYNSWSISHPIIHFCSVGR